MSYEQGKPRQYTPKSIEGNRDRPPETRIVCEIMTPTERQRRRIGAAAADASSAEGAGLATFVAWQESVVEKSILSIGTSTGAPFVHRGAEIRSGAAIAEYGNGELIAELAAEVLDEHSLKEAEKKTSDARSDSSPPATGASPGTATNAEGSVSTFVGGVRAEA